MNGEYLFNDLLKLLVPGFFERFLGIHNDIEVALEIFQNIIKLSFNIFLSVLFLVTCPKFCRKNNFKTLFYGHQFT